MQNLFRRFTLLSFFVLSLFGIANSFTTFTFASETKTLSVTAVEISGTKFWLPSTLVVKKGDSVKIHAISKVGGANNIHGFAIDEFKVQALVNDKGLVDDKGAHLDKDIEFVANKAGVFPIRCHLHPMHVGGQLVVID